MGSTWGPPATNLEIRKLGNATVVAQIAFGQLGWHGELIAMEGRLSLRIEKTFSSPVFPSCGDNPL